MNLNVAKKVLSFVLLITMLIISTVSFAAVPQEEGIEWTYIKEIDGYIDDVSTWYSKKIDIYADTWVYNGSYAGVEVQLQKLDSNGTTWSDVSGKYWYNYPEDRIAVVSVNSLSVSSGTYRLDIYHRAYSTSGVLRETQHNFSPEVTV